MNLGTNDVESNITESDFEASLIRLIQGVHGVWPNAQVMIVVSWNPPRLELRDKSTLSQSN